jgi:uncharacterized membrane-anchored protein YjiN (DUF445 family)
VGALADWFAVVALFRHPLGLPIPHTAVIVERKEQFGETLGEFVEDTFLTPASITARVRAANVGSRAAAWLAQPANADRVAGHILDAATAIADLVRDEDVHRAIEEAVRERIEGVPLAPLAGRTLRLLTEGGRHDAALDAAAAALSRYLGEHGNELRARFPRESPWWLPGAVEDRIFERLLEGARAVLDQMATDREHPMRRELDARIAQLVHDLETSPDLRARGEQLKHDLLSHEQLRAWVATVWTELKRELRTAADDPASPLRARLAAAVRDAGERLQTDPVLAARADAAIDTVVAYLAEHFHGEVADLVSGTIARWDADETARRLELLLGPDLQFIRINGTIVGGLAGLGLHAIAQLLG